uniref:protein-tyrosine-phosphatase n=1 Tax=Syphacia muris TaxID=451379 RepID=A0A158R590_9BILA
MRLLLAPIVPGKTEIIVKPDDSTVPNNTNINFFCRANGQPTPKILWLMNGYNITNPRFKVSLMPNGLSTLRIERVTLGDSGTVTCYAFNDRKHFASASAKLIVLPEDNLPHGFPSFRSHPQLQTFEKGKTATVPCVVDGNPKPRILWLRHQRPLDIRNIKRYSIAKQSREGKAFILIKYFSDDNRKLVSCSYNDVYRVILYTYCAGTLMIQNATENDQGEYECVARNSLGVRHSKSARIYVKTRQVAPYFSRQPKAVYKVAVGGSVNLTCVANGYPFPRVFWKKSGGDPLVNPTSAPFVKNVLKLSRVLETEKYTCVAFSNLGDIAANSTVEVKALPAAPVDFHITNVGSNNATLTWRPGYVENADPVQSYIISYRQKYEERGPYKENEVPSDTFEYTVNGLQPYQIYEFFVSAKSAVGRGSASILREIQTDESVPGSAPVKIEARPLNKDSIIVHWEQPKKPNGKITTKILILTYGCKVISVLFLQRQTDEQTETLYNLDNNRTYYIYIQAFNSKGAGPLSQMVTIITRHGLPGQPVELVAKALDPNRIQLKWKKPTFPAIISGYLIQYNSSQKHFPENSLDAPIESFIVTGLSANTLYSFRVAARTRYGRGAYCEYVTAKTLPNVPVGAPKILQLYAISANALLLNWNSPVEVNHTANLIEYLIKWKPGSIDEPTLDSSEIENDYDNDNDDAITNVDDEWLEMRQTDITNTTAVISGLTPFTQYKVTVTANTDKGYGTTSKAVMNRTKPGGQFIQIR